MTEKRRRRPTPEPAPTTTTIAAAQSIASDHSDFDFDRRIVDSVDESIWRAVYNGHFRLAVPCEVCGRPLVTLASKMARRGPRCAEKAGGK